MKVTQPKNRYCSRCGKAGHNKRTCFALTLAIASLLLTGCASNDWRDPSIRNRQITNTIVMALDTAQTVHIAREPDCYYERNPLLGKHPSVTRVITSGVLYSAGSWAAARWLDKAGWFKTAKVLQYMQLGAHGLAIGNNASRGLEPFGSGCR